MINKFKKNNFLQQTLIWQLARKWQNRLKLLKTIYKTNRVMAIKSYLANDLEFIRIKKEIDSYKKGGIYNFDGIRLPSCVITPDTYLNVIKPCVEKIKYRREEIDIFYKQQKDIYKTLNYWRDNHPETEPDYIGGHIISHGFTYFFKEIIICKDDVVIDLGAAPGDFSAVCIKMGASKVYAFEPEENHGSNLIKVRELNDNKIEIVRKYCDTKTNSQTNSVSLDDFVKINHLNKVDFIKADIEGGEINALIGAKDILKKYRPRLAFCTYHNINDEKDIEKAILEANPDYTIYKEKGIIYAF